MINVVSGKEVVDLILSGMMRILDMLMVCESFFSV